jgi:hypothetical protein
MRGVWTLAVVTCLLAAGTSAAASERPPAPAIAGKTLEGKRASLAAMRGKPVFINVWSSW